MQILLFYLFAINVAGGLFGPLYAVFVVKSIIGASLSTVGFALGLAALAKSIVQIPLARFLDKHLGEKDDFYALIIGAVISVAYPFLLIIVSKISHLYLLETMEGVGAAFLMAAYYSLFARHVDKNSEGFEWSLFSVGGLTISSAIGGALGGVLADTFGFTLLFLISGIINLIILFVLFALYPLLDGARSVALPPFAPLPKNPAAKS
ncbi:MAG: MFS transporter [bacterium]|nr:MFS transporter [bacterium]